LSLCSFGFARSNGVQAKGIGSVHQSPNIAGSKSKCVYKSSGYAASGYKFKLKGKKLLENVL